MKKIICASLLLAATLTHAQTLDEANELFSMRGEDTQNAQAAADMYAQLASNVRSEQSKGQLLTRQSLALYWVAGRQPKEDDRERIHEQAYKIADQAIILLNTEGDRFGSTPANNDAQGKYDLAEAHYASAINMGKWAEARGVLASLGQWGNMKKHLDAVIANDDSVADYGAYRTRGRAWLKLPFTHGGSKNKSLKDLRLAYKKTFNEEFATSSNSTTTLYYLDTLVAKKIDGDEFCDAYYGLLDAADYDMEELQELSPEFAPEFKIDLQKFEDGEDFEEDIHEWADSNC